MHGLIGLGMPLQAGGRSYSYEFLRNCMVPKLLLTGAEDLFAPRPVMEQTFAEAPGNTEMRNTSLWACLAHPHQSWTNSGWSCGSGLLHTSFLGWDKREEERATLSRRVGPEICVHV